MSQKKIAAYFGVSVATVSKALNDSHDISIALKKKIKGYADKIGYKKNFSALALRKKTSVKNVAVIIPNFCFFNEVIKYDASRDYGNKHAKRIARLLTYWLC